MEFLATYWYWFLAGWFVCHAVAATNHLWVMASIGSFFEEGFSFIKRVLPTLLFGIAGLGCFVLAIIGVVARFAG